MASSNKDDYDYGSIEFPALPDVILPYAFERAVRKLWFPFVAVCRALRVDERDQRRKLKNNHDYISDYVPFPTTGGYQKVLSIEWDSLAMFIAAIQEQRIQDEVIQRRVRHVKVRIFQKAREVLLVAQDVLEAPDQPSSIQAIDTDQVTSILLMNEERIRRLERGQRRMETAVFVVPADDEGDDFADDAQPYTDMPRQGRCPHCGGRIEIINQTFIRGLPNQPED